MIAEINHKIISDQEDELTGNFFGNMRYLPYSRGLKKIFDEYARSPKDPIFETILKGLDADEFKCEFWDRVEGLCEIDCMLNINGVAIGVEVKLYSGLSGDDQIEREVEMLKATYDNAPKLLLFVAKQNAVLEVYEANYEFAISKDVHLGFITWEDICRGLDLVEVITPYENLIISDLKELLCHKGFDTFTGFNIEASSLEARKMTYGERIHNAFDIVFETYKRIEKLMEKCQTAEVNEQYHMPTRKFLRYSSDQSWTGWIYWTFILLYQRKEDGIMMKHNGWIDAPVYAVEINVDAETCLEPELNVGKYTFKDICDWPKGCSPASYYVFYEPAHLQGGKMWDANEGNGYTVITPKEYYRDKVERVYKGFEQVIKKSFPLTDITGDNYKDIIFGTIEELHMLP